VAEGHSNKDIARLLNRSLKTIEFHKTRIMRILGVKRTAELTQYAISHRIVTP
jgi:DNA-binding NarL/FixJ family response regulator